MIVGPANTTLSSVASNGYAVAADVSSLYEGVFFWLSKTGETSKYCVVTEIDRGTKTIGIRFVEDKVSGRSDVTAYNGGTVSIPQQLWSNPDGDNTYGSADFNGSVTITNNLTIYGILSLPQYATADLPTASSYLGGIAYDTTAEVPVYSDGSIWAAIGGGATGYATVQYDASSLTQRNILNFKVPGFLAADNAGSTRTDVSLQGIAVSNAITTAAVTYYVNAATGSDSNNGTSAGTPFATINKALSLVPMFLNYTITINVYAGTYSETLSVVTPQTNPGSCLIDIVGQDWTAVTPTTGVASGTFDASFTPNPTRHTASVAGAGWTSGDLRGKFVKVTSGTNSGAYLPIVDNTATELTLGLVANSTSNNGRNITSATFEIVVPAVIITRQGSATYLLSASGSPFDLPNLSTGPSLRIRNVEFQRGSATQIITLGQGSNLRLDSCKFTSASSGIFINMPSTGSRLFMLECNATLQTYWIQCTGPSCNATLRNCGSYGGSGWVSVLSSGYTTFAASGVCLGASSEIFAVRSAVLMVTQHFYCTAGTRFVGIYGAGSVILLQNGASLSNSWLVKTQSTSAVATIQNNSASKASFNTITCSGGTTFDSCGIGFDLQTTHNIVDLTSATITNSTTWGVQMAGNKLSAFNQVITTSGTTMSGNTSGDFTLDGTTATSIADLRADPDKSIVNADLFNRLAEY